MMYHKFINQDIKSANTGGIDVVFGKEIVIYIWDICVRTLAGNLHFIFSNINNIRTHCYVGDY